MRPTTKLRAGEQLYLHHPPETEPEVDDRIEVLWECDGVIAVYKPAGLPMHQVGAYHKNTFTSLVHDRVGHEWSAVHRLDLETSGIVLCANSPELRTALTELWSKRAVQKTYVAIVRGVPGEDVWECREPIGDAVGSSIRIKGWVHPAGQTAHTRFRVLEVSADNDGRSFSLIAATPVTGRRNQIRIHAAFAGHVIVGDKLFHPDEQVFQEYFVNGNTDNVIRQVEHSRLCLHATRLNFVHPVSGEPCQVDASIPDDMLEFWRGVSI